MGMAEELYLFVLVAGSRYFFLHLVALPVFIGKRYENFGFSAIFLANRLVSWIRLFLSGIISRTSKDDL